MVLQTQVLSLKFQNHNKNEKCYTYENISTDKYNISVSVLFSEIAE
jgi:hypothetical protein